MNKTKKVIKICVVLVILVLIVTIIGLLLLKYAVEGEKNMPFNVSKIAVISTAEGIQQDNDITRWNLKIVQNNDIYIYINKNEDYEGTEVIHKITLDNFNVLNNPKNGKIQMYRPANEEKTVYKDEIQYIINDKLEYNGSTKNSLTNLEIANQGGIMTFRVCNNDIGEYMSQEGEVEHSGKLIKTLGLSQEDIKCKMEFDLSIQTKSKKTYKTNVVLNLPAGNIIEEGISNYEIDGINELIFKRI